MRFGAMNFPVAPVTDEIEALARLGFDYLELAMDPPMAHHHVVASNRTRIVRGLKDAGLGLVCHLPTFVSTADLTQSIRQASIDEMRASLVVAAELGAEKVVMHPSMANGMGPFVLDTVRGYAFDFYALMAGEARRLGVSICLENMFPRNRLGVEPDDLEAIFDAFPDFRLTLDTGHANIDDRRGKRLKGLVQRFGERIAHLHFSDNHGKLDDHLAVGQGRINFRDLVSRLHLLAYDGTATLEVFDADRQLLVSSRQRIEAMVADLGPC
jgi:sugar phosphate isomerase/epimerase